jgi:hypothetical protein
MGKPTKLSLVGRDAAITPFPQDWKLYINNRIVKSYHDQPNVASMMANLVIPIEYDGKYEAEIPQQNDLDDAEIGMEPGIADTELEGDTINVKTPQIFQTMKLSSDKWAQLFAGQNKPNLVLARMAQKIKNREDKYIFQGKTGICSGIITDATTLGSSAGHWGIASNGKLTHFQTDIQTIISLLDAAGIPNNYPIDIGLTSYAFSLIDTATLDYNPDITNKMLAERKLRGGKFYATNNIQASVSSSSNTMFVSVRAPEEEAGWAILRSGLDIQREQLLWGYRVGVRQKVGYKILDANMVYKMTSISCATS